MGWLEAGRGWPDGADHRQSKKSRRGKSRLQIKREMLEQDPFCFYCRCPLTIFTATFDHYIPRSKGGGGNRSNLRLACVKCNRDKADKIVIHPGTKP